MMLLDVAVSFIVAVLCGLGSGGGLLVLYLTAVSGMTQIKAQGVNLLFFLSASVGAFAVNRKNNLIDFKTVAVIAASGIPMSILGSFLATLVKGTLLGKMYGALLVLSGIYYFLEKKE